MFANKYLIHGHAIVSVDDRIADASGGTPPGLRNDADWARFQAALDRAVVTVLGRLGHEANPNVKRRNRLVLSSHAHGIERRGSEWWWNPAEASLAEALAAAAPQGGIVAVPGGRRVFDLFLALGYDAFHLSQAERLRIPGGTPLFSGVLEGKTAAEILAANGLVAGKTEVLDPAAAISLRIWQSRA